MQCYGITYLPELWPEMLDVARDIESASVRAQALHTLSMHLPNLWLEVINAVRRITDEPAKSNVLRSLSSDLPVDLLPDALDITREIKEVYAQSSTLKQPNTVFTFRTTFRSADHGERDR